MAVVPPIKGMMRTRFYKTLTFSFAFGSSLAWGFWYFYHVPRVQIRDAYYAKINANKE
ncbi:cytochrome c oxidase subunit 7 [Malassezia restricta]|uniref:cytochrome c oxidase subunit 7 n=1 Tax=Malassezia restricta TaxID=76775 RepID=UPI000DD16CF1|nr:cytochrome c oxidase subunit 7 [Malassezia restricta]AXA51293.1 cytochrome c oxidase subunit 7 [Malassezia restricta]